MMFDELIISFITLEAQIRSNLPALGIILLLPWSIYFISFINNKILLLGIIPRRVRGLPGIVFAPLLHANFNHIFFNSIPLLVLSAFILINGLSYYVTVTVLITLLSGLAVWCFGNYGLHIGASGIVTGYWGFLVTNIYYHTTFTAVILGILSIYYFAGIFLGIFPQQKGVSWQGHLFGLIAGITVSYLVKIYPQFFSIQ